MPHDENEIGVIWINTLKNGKCFGGRVFDIPPDGLTVHLVPFNGTRQDGSSYEGLKVIKTE